MDMDNLGDYYILFWLCTNCIGTNPNPDSGNLSITYFAYHCHANGRGYDGIRANPKPLTSYISVTQAASRYNANR
jgi:hypothetical protein